MTRKPWVGECAYCGTVSELTRDHVIPKSLFTKPRPNNPVIVPACKACNQEKSATDDYLRDFLVTDAYSSESMIAKQVQERMLSSVRQKSSVFAKQLLQGAQPQSLYSPGGIYIGEILKFEFAGGLIFPRIVRGLHYNLTQKRIPDNYEFRVFRPDPMSGGEILENVLRQPHQAFGVGDNGEFKGILQISTEDEFSTIWHLWFYESVLVVIFSEPPPAPAVVRYSPLD